MSLTLVDDPSTFPSSVVVPSNGEARTADSVQTPFQQLANRTANIRARVEAIAPAAITGVSLLFRVANDAALLALTSSIHTDKAHCVVDGVGLYEYDVASTATAGAPFVRTPTDVGGGAGRWILVGAGRGALDVANGVPQLDSTSRIAATKLRNGIIQVAQANFRSPGIVLTTSSTSYVDVPGFTVTLTGCLAGDVIDISAHHTVATPAGNQMNTSVTVIDGASTTLLTQHQTEESLSVSVSHCAAYTVINGGSVDVKLQAHTTIGSNCFIVAMANLVARLIRP